MMALPVFVFLLVVCLFLSLALLWRLDWFHRGPSSSRVGAKRTAVQRLLKPRSPRRLPRLSSRLHYLIGWRVGPWVCASLVRGQKPPGSTETDTHRRLRLSLSAVR